MMHKLFIARYGTLQIGHYYYYFSQVLNDVCCACHCMVLFYSKCYTQIFPHQLQIQMAARHMPQTQIIPQFFPCHWLGKFYVYGGNVHASDGGSTHCSGCVVNGISAKTAC